MRVIAAASVLAILAGCATAPRGGMATVEREFTVLDPEGHPVQGARLSLDGARIASEPGSHYFAGPSEATTDEAGRAVLVLPAALGEAQEPVMLATISIDHPDFVRTRTDWPVAEGIVRAKRGMPMRLDLVPPAGMTLADAKPIASFLDLKFADGALSTRRFPPRPRWTIIEATTTDGAKLYSGMVRMPAPPAEGAVHEVRLAPAREVRVRVEGLPRQFGPAYVYYCASLSDTDGKPVRVLTEKEFEGCSMEFGCGTIQSPHYFGSADISADGTATLLVPASAELIEAYSFVEGYGLPPQDGKTGWAALLDIRNAATHTLSLLPRATARVRAVDESGADLPEAVIHPYPGLYFRVGTSSVVPCDGVRGSAQRMVNIACIQEGSVRGAGEVRGLLPVKGSVTAELAGWEIVDPATGNPLFAQEFDIPPPGTEQRIVMRPARPLESSAQK